MATQTNQLGCRHAHFRCHPSRRGEVDGNHATYARRSRVYRSRHLDSCRSYKTSWKSVVTLLMVRPRPIGVVESTSSMKKVLTNARKHRSINSLERTAFTHWMTEKFVKQATNRPLAVLTNEVGKGGWYE